MTSHQAGVGKLIGLSVGADDRMTGPVSMRVLVAQADQRPDHSQRA